MEYITTELTLIAPDFSAEGEPDDLLVEALEKSTDIVLEYSKIAQAIAQMNSNVGALGLYKSFQRILEKYNHPIGYSGIRQDTDFDFYKFIGHELFTSFISCLIFERRWNLISSILDEDIFVQNTFRGASAVPYTEISSYVNLLEYRNRRLKLNKRFVHADMLNERHTQGGNCKIFSNETIFGS